MAKFKVGDKVVWLHFHSDSLSNETIKEVWKDGTYRVDSGFANERELYPGRVAKEAEGVTGMRDIGGGRFSTPHFPNKWFDLNGRVGINSRACNAKFKVGDVVSVKREAAEMIDNPALARKRGRVTKVLPGGYYEVDGELGATGLELTDAELTLANTRACNGVRSRNSVVAKALNACANAAYPKAIDLGVGNWEATLMPRYNMLILEKGDYRTKDYVNIEGTIDEVKRKVARVAKGKDLSDAMSVCSRAAQEMEKYQKAERSHGRKPANACGTARNATFGSVEDAERYSEQAVRAAKSRVFGEMNTLKDVVRALKGYPDSKTVQKNLLTLEWALEEIKKAAQTLA